jgi:hypothetical protein
MITPIEIENVIKTTANMSPKDKRAFLEINYNKEEVLLIYKAMLSAKQMNPLKSSVNFDTVKEPPPLYDYNDWRNSEIKECEPLEPVENPAKEPEQIKEVIKYIEVVKYEERECSPLNNNYMIDICEGVYRIIINEATTIELDMNSKTFKITDDKATINNTILNIKI